MPDYSNFRADIAGIALEDNPAIVRQKSRDFFWYSPILRGQLEGVTADLVVSPSNTDEVVRVMRATFKHNVPVTPRGGGTGNYGQAMPLAGGLILDMSRMTAVKEIGTGRVVAEAGANMGRLNAKLRENGQEFRFHPSTIATSTIAGFVAGGSGGVGSITWGGLPELGNILRLRIVTMEEEPRVLDLTGWDIQKVAHAYGVNGVIVEVELPLAPAYDWIDMLVEFDTMERALGLGSDLAWRSGLLLKELAIFDPRVAPISFTRHRTWLDTTKSIVALMVAPHALVPLEAAISHHGGRIAFRSDDAAPTKGLPHIYELCWNHTTLRAIKSDAKWTYLQTLYPNPGSTELILKMADEFKDELLTHIEYIKLDGQPSAVGLPLVYHRSNARLEEIMRLHEEAGCVVFNPHRYTLEEGGMKQSDPMQLSFKQEADPKGLLNPGKMIAFDDPNFDFKTGKTYLFQGLNEQRERAS